MSTNFIPPYAQQAIDNITAFQKLVLTLDSEVPKDLPLDADTNGTMLAAPSRYTDDLLRQAYGETIPPPEPDTRTLAERAAIRTAEQDTDPVTEQDSLLFMGMTPPEDDAEDDVEDDDEDDAEDDANAHDEDGTEDVQSSSDNYEVNLIHNLHAQAGSKKRRKKKQQK